MLKILLGTAFVTLMVGCAVHSNERQGAADMFAARGVPNATHVPPVIVPMMPTSRPAGPAFPRVFRWAWGKSDDDPCGNLWVPCGAYKEVEAGVKRACPIEDGKPGFS